MFIEELQNRSYKLNTKGGFYYGTTFDANLDLFCMASRYTSELTLERLFTKAYNEDKYILSAIILYNLDIREGKGERRLFKYLFNLMCKKDEELGRKILSYIPKLGRYDYIFSTYGSLVWKDTINLVKDQLAIDIKSEHPSLLAKWLPSLRTHNKNNPLAKRLTVELGISEKEYRKLLSSLRTKLNIVEKKVTNKDYQINYETVPSKAMKLYSKCFMINDKDRFSEYLEMLKAGNVKINSKVLAPNELVKAIWHDHAIPDVINAQWDSLDNYFDSNNSNVLVVADTSGSMYDYDELPISSSVGLALYAATHNKGVFHNKFINFSNNPTFQMVSGNTLSEMIESIDYSNWAQSTNIDLAIEMILDATLSSKDDCPSHLLIISDMEFDQCTNGKTNFQYWKSRYEENGLTMPKIIFWNVAGEVAGVPVTKNENDVIIVQGFSQTIFKGIFKIENYSPIGAMLEILKPYLLMV